MSAESLAGLLARCLRAAGVTRAFRSPGHALPAPAGIEVVDVPDAALGDLLADADGRLSRSPSARPGLALLDGRRIRLSSEPGEEVLAHPVLDPAQLPGAVAGWTVGQVHAALELEIDLDLDAPAPPASSPYVPPGGRRPTRHALAVAGLARHRDRRRLRCRRATARSPEWPRPPAAPVPAWWPPPARSACSRSTTRRGAASSASRSPTPPCRACVGRRAGDRRRPRSGRGARGGARRCPGARGRAVAPRADGPPLARSRAGPRPGAGRSGGRWSTVSPRSRPPAGRRPSLPLHPARAVADLADVLDPEELVLADPGPAAPLAAAGVGRPAGRLGRGALVPGPRLRRRPPRSSPASTAGPRWRW